MLHDEGWRMLGASEAQPFPGEEGMRPLCCPGLPLLPGENIQADTDVTVERSTRLFMEQVEMKKEETSRCK